MQISIRFVVTISLLLCAAAGSPAGARRPRAVALQAKAVSVDTTGFNRDVKPVIARNCATCHSAELAAGGLNIAPFLEAQSVRDLRQGWERIVRRVRTGEMPPKGAPRPAQPVVEALVKYVEGEMEKADADVAPDPGRVTARRLNRNEYSNTIRDLLAVDFRATGDFPTDDSGEGFDNIADVLSISPLLMSKYLDAAENIAARAVGTVALPKPVKAAYEPKAQNIRRIDVSTVEAFHRVDFDGDYDIVIGLPGERAADAKPVQLGFWMDGRLVKQMEVETKPSKLVYFSPYSEAQMRVFLPEGDHVFRAAFIDDAFIKTLPEARYYSSKYNKFPDSISFSGPFPSAVERPSLKKIFICDPASGRACQEKIVSALAHRAWRRPVAPAEVARLMRFVDLAAQRREDARHGIQLALQAILVSPNFLFRVERDPKPLDPAAVHRVTDVELASRLSYFLWSSMPDDELLGLAESGKLHEPAVLDAQVKRLMADPRSSALADNFAGQWLETRNLDSVKPDPDKYLRWGPELRNAMMTETRMYFDYMLRENRPMREFLSSRYTFLNERLAQFYGIGGVAGPEFRKVDLATDQRGGILSQASVLTVSSYPSRTSPTIRGKYILNNILGAPPPPPPPDVPPLDASKVGSEVSLRKQLEEHRSNAVCASCHSKMDVLGFGLENYNGIGKWRNLDGKIVIDPSGTLPNGKSFTTAAEFRNVLLAQLPDFARCVSEKMMIYALGRGLHPYDRPAVKRILTKLETSDYPFQSLIYEVVHSLPFQSRRGEEAPVPTPGLKETAKR